MPDARDSGPRVPPRWFVRAAWSVHRALLRVTGSRAGLWMPSNRRGWGALRLTVVGRRSGRERDVVLGYLEDGDDLVLLVMNGWGEGEPAWWLNLRDRPDATVLLAGGRPRRVAAHEARGAEHERLWARWRAVEPDLDRHAAHRATPTRVVVLRPAQASSATE